MKKNIISIGLILVFGNLSAQNNCPPINRYSTQFVSDGKDSSSLHLPLNFIISADSIIVSLDSLGKNRFMAFRIFGEACFWNNDFTKGKTEYKLFLGAEKGKLPQNPILNIIKENKENTRIEILYENSQKRIFYP